jgi:hypothetical protein
MSRTPTILTDKRAELAYERTQLVSRISDLDKHIEALDYALQVVDPNWVPSNKIKRPMRKPRLPRGALSQNCLSLLRRHGALWTTELTKMIGEQFKLKFDDRKAELSFASSVAVALRRYEGQGVVEITERDEHTRGLKWRLRTGEDGRLSIKKASTKG